MIEATVILDSISRQGHRLTTFQLRYPKFIHGEFMTHRVFSRNASSSRAVPVGKLIEEVMSDELRATPVWWGKHQAGMQAAEELSDEPVILQPGDRDVYGREVTETTEMWSSRRYAKAAWRTAALGACLHAEKMITLGMHKQLVNRILEPFTHINVVVTATEYMNFFGLRLDSGAQPEMQALAQAMWTAYQASSPRVLVRGQWHMPYISNEDIYEFTREYGGGINDLFTKVSVARCARVSYLSFETGKRSTVDEDLVLYDKLMGAQPLHASPAEHQATPDECLSVTEAPVQYNEEGPFKQVGWQHPQEHGNLAGWRQYRKMLPGENLAPLPEKYRS